MTVTDLLTRLRALDVHVRLEDGRVKVTAVKGRLTPELQEEMRARKGEILEALQNAATSSRAARVAIPFVATVRDGSPLPLSMFQERLWLLDRLQPGLTAYNLAVLHASMTATDADRLADAIRRVLSRHEILRSRFVMQTDRPSVELMSVDDVPVEFEDLRSFSVEACKVRLNETLHEAAHRPFALAEEAPVRFRIFRLPSSRAALLISAHHIALDSWSLSLLLREIAAMYASPADVSEQPALQYTDFARWQREVANQADMPERLQFWKQRLSGLPEFSTFVPDFPRRIDGSNNGVTFVREWPISLYERVRELARAESATVYMVLLAAFAAVLQRHTGQDDLAVGCPIGTRDHAQLENLIGPILNPLVLRFDFSDDPSFKTLVAKAREALLEGHAHQETPFARIVQALSPERSLGHAPLFQTAVVLHNAPDVADVSLVSGGAIYDVSIFAKERADTLELSFEYRSDLYSEATIVRIQEHLEQLIGAAAANPASPVSRLALISDAERAQLLEQFNDTNRDVDRATVVEQIRRVASRQPNAVAVTDSIGALTYQMLVQRAETVARQLRAPGAGRGTIVALATDRTCNMVVAALGVLMSGAAYVPIDLDYPADRVALMLSDSGTRHIVTTRASQAQLGSAAESLIAVWVDDCAAAIGADALAEEAPRANDTAYVIYTSGSTGKPKGVRVPHATVSNFLGAMRDRPGFTAEDVLVSVTSMSFDISVLELFLPLVQGGQVVIASREDVTDGARLANLLQHSAATMLQSTPSGLRLLQNANWAGLPSLTVICGGEPMPADLAAWLHPRIDTLWNAYGPTETTVWSTFSRIHGDGPVTIGTPIANTQVYVLDRQKQLVPVGTPGEICIGGDGVAEGYHERPDLTAERFVANPFGSGRMYRTGDVGRWRADGRLEHLGRSDGQIKVRGYRIETGEIEVALASHPQVRAAVVDVRLASENLPRIVAWVHLREGGMCTASELREHLRQSLPEFMIPSLVTMIDAIPLTPNGKIDRRALPEPFTSGGMLSSEYVPPATPTEQVIAEIWQRLLGIERVSATDGFFELGGHSLLAMQAAREISLRTNCEFEPRLMFFRTLRQLADTCDQPSAAVPTTA